MKATLYFLAGIIFTYLFGALVAWDVNPDNWHIVWRLWCLVWAVFWGLSGFVYGGMLDDHSHRIERSKYRPRRLD